jgi:hypothetical protein
MPGDDEGENSFFIDAKAARPHPEEHRFGDASRRMDTSATLPAARIAPELIQNLPPERAWGMPGAERTRGLVCKSEKHTS